MVDLEALFRRLSACIQCIDTMKQTDMLFLDTTAMGLIMLVVQLWGRVQDKILKATATCQRVCACAKQYINIQLTVLRTLSSGPGDILCN